MSNFRSKNSNELRATNFLFQLQMAANDLAGGIYKDFCYMAIIAIPGILLCIWVADRFGRKQANLIPLFIGMFNRGHKKGRPL